MKKIDTTLPDVKLIKPDTFTDKRGFFHVLWDYRTLGFEPVYQYTTESKMGVLRGLHFQLEPHGQEKLVQVTNGSIFDVVVSLETGQFEVFYLTPHQHLYIPPGYAHGFYVSNAWADVVYLLSDYYYPSLEVSIDPFDRDLSIPWQLREDTELLMSEKDKNGISYADACLAWRRSVEQS